MFRLKELWQCCLVLAILTCHQTRAHQKVEVNSTTTCAPPRNTTIPGDGDKPGDGTEGEFTDLCRDFQNLRSLIDRDALVDIIQTHYQCDSKFRRAMEYYNTAQYRQVALMLQQSTAYRSLLLELQNDGVDTSDIETIVDIIACIVLPVPMADTDCDCKAVKGHTFMSDVLVAMPRRKVHDYLTLARSNQSNFGLLVSALTSPDFQARLRANLVKRDMVRPLRILRRNGWDLEELLRGTLTILSW